jgi:hypothetical protein
VTLRLFEYWFDEDHELDGQQFRYHFCQREAFGAPGICRVAGIAALARVSRRAV